MNDVMHQFISLTKTLVADTKKCYGKDSRKLCPVSINEYEILPC